MYYYGIYSGLICNLFSEKGMHLVLFIHPKYSVS